MEKKLILLLLLFVCIHSSGTLYAQWTEEDSVLIEDILSGKRQIYLNPETLKAIKEGTLINIEQLQPKLLSAPPILPLCKDFDIAPVDSLYDSEIDFSTMPPAVFALYIHSKNIRSETIDSLLRGAFTMPDLTDKNWLKIGNTPITVTARADNIYNNTVKDGYKRGGFVGTARITFSLNDILMGIFSKTERNKRRNKKKAQAWKTYNDYP